MQFIDIKNVRTGKHLNNYELTYINKAGKEKIYEIVSRNNIKTVSELGRKPSGLSIIAYMDEKMLLLREFRMGVNKHIYNLCAGVIEENETIEECIRRELYEETGLSVKKIRHILPPSFSAPAISDVSTYIAFVDVEGVITDHTSENEEIQAAFYSKEQILELIDKYEFSSRAQLAAYNFAIS